MAERRHWLASSPERHLAELNGSDELLVETSEFLETGLPRNLTTAQRAAQLGLHLEPDFLLLTGPQLHVVAGCVCFPSMWAPEEKFGRPLSEVHGPVPGLNDQLGSQLERFFSRLKPGVAWERSNWGLSRSAELNQHPSRMLPRLADHDSPEEIWLRVEHQSLIRLPRSDAVLFGIRIENVPLPEVITHGPTRAGLRHQLSTMPEATLAYKGLAAARTNLLRLLAG